jgi:CRP-like cAMP-binding protein
MAFIDEEPRSASLIALAPVSCYCLTRENLDSLCRVAPNVGKELFFGSPKGRVGA